MCFMFGIKGVVRSINLLSNLLTEVFMTVLEDGTSFSNINSLSVPLHISLPFLLLKS